MAPGAGAQPGNRINSTFASYLLFNYICVRCIFHVKQDVQESFNSFGAITKVLANADSETGSYLLVFQVTFEIPVVQDIVLLPGEVGIAANTRATQTFKGFIKDGANNHTLFNGCRRDILSETLGNKTHKSQICFP